MAQIPGGLSEVEVNEWPEIEAKIVESLADLGAQDNSPALSFGKIISVHKQVVGGLMYHVTIEIVHNNQQKECKLRIFERPWTGERSVDIECDEQTFNVKRNTKK